MRTITLTYDSTTRRLSADDLTGGTVVDNASTVLTVEGLPEGEASVLWGVQVRDEEGAYYPFSDLDDSGSAPIPGGVLRWCNGGRLPVALRILHDDGTVESSVNRVTLAVTVYPDSVDSVAEVMGDKVMMYGDSWTWQERWTYDKDAVAIWDGSLWLSLRDGNAGHEPSYDSEWWIMVDRDIPSDDLPLMDGTASPGESRRWSRGDHVHPTDTTRASVDALQAEAEERARQDQALHDRVDTMATAESLAEEVQARKDADAALGGRIDGEEQARAQADTALGVRIDGEASARQQADQAEAQARQAADQTLQQAIDAEEQARISADQTLQADIDTRALQTALDAEESARQQADSAIQADVDSRIPRSLPSSIVQDVTVAQTPTAVTLTLDRVDPDTGAGADQVRSLPVASASQAGVMSSAQVTQLQQASGDIEMLKGQSARYTVHLDTETPTQEQLQAAYDAITPAPPSPPKDGTTLLDLTYDKEYTWFATSSQWVDRGQTVVSLATQASPGIVQGADADGKVYVEGDGTMSVKGWDAVKDGIANNASAIGTEASARQSGDEELQQQISAEASARQSADATLQQNINQRVPVIRRVNGKELSADITITKSDVGLGSVDNTSDAAKPISTATQQALDAKADASALSAEAAARQQADNTLQADIDTKQDTVTGGATTILSANLTANRALISSSAGKVTVSAVTASELAYLDGVTSGIQAQLNAKVPKAWPTSDAGKFLAIASDGQVEAIASSVEVSFADIKGDATDNASLASALNGKVPTSRTVNGKALSANITLGKGDVGLGNVDNTSDAAKPISTATQTALNAKQNTITGAATTITGSNLTANRALIANGSGKVAVSAVTSTELGYLDGVTSAIQTQLNAKVPTSRTINGKALTANISITKADVGLSNVNNTSDLNKPISTATQAALDGKADNSRIPFVAWSATWGQGLEINSGMEISQETYFGGGSDSGTVFLLVLQCLDGDRTNDAVIVPVVQYSGATSEVEFGIPGTRNPPQRAKLRFNWGVYPDVWLEISRQPITSTGGTGWTSADGWFKLTSVIRIQPSPTRMPRD